MVRVKGCFLSTDENFADRWIMITYAVVERWRPAIYMNMLQGGLVFVFLDGGRYENVIELLRVLVKDVCISFHRWNVDHFIKLSQESCKRRKHRPSLDILVEIAGCNYLRFGIAVKHAFNEILSQTSSPSRSKRSNQSLTATIATCCLRVSTGKLIGGLASPCVEELPPLELRWTLIV